MDSISIFLAKYLVLLFPIALIYVLAKTARPNLTRALGLLVISGIIAVLMAKITEKLYYNPRPFTNPDIIPLVKHAADNGFPSEHATYSMNLAALFYVLNRRIGKIVIVLAVLVGIGRVLVHVHSPIDIIVGFIIGAASVWLATIIWPVLSAKLRLTDKV